ncbi:MAG: TIGR03663 family protein [Deltaproteobacteria bacterium]|nr:TIGR03663 family protein [Deltaproteobacteria bacterium]
MAIPRTLFHFLLVFMLMGTLVLFIHQLEIRPVHHDESVNGWFVNQVVKDGVYSYSPQHYHGPSFFYLAYLSSKLFGLGLFSIRFVAVVSGCLLCLSPLFLKREIGDAGTLTGLLVFVSSPAFLYYSRYAIHEILLVCFFSFSALSLYRYLISGQRSYLMAGAFMLGCAAATKETVVIYMFGMTTGLIVSLVFSRDLRPDFTGLLKDRLAPSNLLLGVISLLVALSLWFDGKGLMDFVGSYSFYFQLGKAQSGHEKAWFYYIMLFLREETFIMLGGIFGAFWALFKRKAFDLFCLAWGATVLVFQSSIGYKTPWIILNLMLPFVFLFSSSFNDLLGQMKRRSYVWILVVFVLLISGASLRKGILYSYRTFSQPENPYAYMQTFSRAYDLSNKVKSILDKHKDIRVAFVSPLEWPYPFILRDYKQIDYWKRIPEGLNSPVIVSEVKQRVKLIRILKDKEYLFESYRVRPGMNLDLFIRRDLL